MYQEYFDLREKAFGNTPDPKFLFPSKQHQEALARLEYVLEECGIALITGDIGTGKTTISRALIDSLDPRFRPILILNPCFGANQFLRLLARKLDLKPLRLKSELVEQIHNRLFQLYDQSVFPVLIIDEAQLIQGKSFFDEIRLLTNFQLDHTNLLTVILMGQPELAKRLRHPAYTALNQRITLRYHLKPLNEQEVLAYLLHRWKTAGGSPGGFPFNPLSVQKIFAYSGGVPRMVNLLATTCLMDALAKETKEVEHEMVDIQAGDIGMLTAKGRTR